MLTQAAAKAASPRDRAYKLADSGGLFLYVTPTGTKSWRLKYRFARREKLLVLGRFPELALPEARRRREEAKAALREGRDPSVKRETIDRFEQLARAWYGHAAPDWSPAHAADVITSLERDVFPALGARPVRAIDPPELLCILREVERRGCVETARRLRQRLSAIFGFGIGEGLADSDPAAQLGRAMKSAPLARPMPALTQIESCRDLLEACAAQYRWKAVGASIHLAAQFLALTAVRLEAVRGARWEEIEDLHGGAPLWRVPAARMKLKRAKKDDARFDHLVPLSPVAITVLKSAQDLHPENANSHDPENANLHGLIFPGRAGAPIGEGAIGALYARTGFAGQHVPHGWRASFSTIMNEQLGPEWRADIDRALAHSPKDKVEAAYNRAQLLDRRRALFERWGAMLAG